MSHILIKRLIHNLYLTYFSDMSREYERRKGRQINSSTKLRMDSNLISSKSHRECSEKRKELDNVMRKARESQSNYWNKKLLEVEEKDPNRWRHSGFKEMYVSSHSSGDAKNQVRSPKRRSSRPRSPRPRSPHTPKSRNLRNRYSRSPRRKSPRVRNSNTPHPRSPVIKKSHSPRLRSPKIRKFNPSRSRSPRNLHNRSQNTHSRQAKSPSSESSCSDRSCSVCSPKEKHLALNTSKSRSRSTSPVLIRSNVKDVSLNTKLIERPNSPSSPRSQSPSLTQHLLNQTKNLKTGKKDKYRHKFTEDLRIPASIQMVSILNFFFIFTTKNHHTLFKNSLQNYKLLLF